MRSANLVNQSVREALLARFGLELVKVNPSAPSHLDAATALVRAIHAIAGETSIALAMVDPVQPWPPASNVWFTEPDGTIHKELTGNVNRGHGVCGRVVEDPTGWFHIDDALGPNARPSVFERRHCPACLGLIEPLAGVGPAPARRIR
jgi:hypothetical protein